MCVVNQIKNDWVGLLSKEQEDEECDATNMIVAQQLVTKMYFLFD